MFHTLGRYIANRPGWIVAVWVALACAAGIWDYYAPPPPPDDMGSFLPADHPYSVAVATAKKAFPAQAAQSYIVIIAQRPAGLTRSDIDWLDRTARAAGRATERRVLSPAVPFLRPRLVSEDNQAAMAVVNLSTNMISGVSAEAVNTTEHLIARQPPPEGLTVELTGPAAIGRDYSLATRDALHRTTWVTVIAVLTILIVVYRSPVGAFVPLLAIGLSVYLALVVLAVLGRVVGWDVSTIERIFVIVLLFGAGVDYALFWIARYRESLHELPDLPTAASEASRHAGPAVLFSAITTMVGMCALLTADLGPSRGAGKVLLVALWMALLAGLTLAPAIARRLGRALFWPLGPTARATYAQRVIWPALAERLVRAPLVVLLVGVLALAVPAAMAMQMQPRFDALAELPAGTTSQRGFQIAETHFSRGQLYSNKLLIEFGQRPPAPEQLREISARIRERFLSVPGVEDVYSLDSPLGRNMQVDRGPLSGLLGPLAGAIEHSASGYYLAEEPPTLLFDLMIDRPPFSLEAMNIIEQVRAIATEQQTGAFASARVHLTGLTPYIMAVRDVSGRDQWRVMILATILIAAIVYALVRDVPLTVFMVFSTLLTYGATLKLTELFFIHVMGTQGIDWKVRLIVFVIVVAVGQDYNIFLVSRLMEEQRRTSRTEAVRRAVISTGSVISSCGLIMAATLGSLWAGKLALLQQVGFALALGILIDTYFVRPLLIPSFFLVIRARGLTEAKHQYSGSS